MDEELLNSTPEEISTLAQEITENLLPTKSSSLYNKAYNNFMAWKLDHKASSFSENVLLAYFQSLHNKFKPSSLWVEYSKLKSTINLYHQTDISKYAKLLAFLKRKSEGFKAKKAQTFSPNHLKTFIDEAPDNIYLLTKVAVIFGIMGACRRQELHNLKINDVIDAHNTLIVHIMNTKNRIDRTFTVTGKYYEICKKYLNLRPNPCNNQNFFLRYFKGKCTIQNVGINTFGQMGKNVAAHLKLPNPELYTGHAFRRTSATLLVDAGGDVTALKRHGGWKSTTVAEGYIDNSINSRKKVSNLLMTSIEKTQDNTPFISVQKTEPQHMNPPESEPLSTSPNTAPTLSQIIHQNTDLHINTAVKPTNVPNITISHNTIQNLHLHFHK
ncbi:uncharacterized protein LOC126380733 [Pectinophora gossypiella]|uniref:uncharacterized protein LOC126380733 n=1 Tax=Pectinophora gossypiella TaxID=13191 RepID=UPI00214EC2BB|nr:uncharacterized protein LOC126380733 [Pectinophora gossypiella]